MSDRKLSLLVKNQDPVILNAQDTVQHACRCMSERGVGAVLITEPGGRLTGIFTGRDAVRVVRHNVDAAHTTLAATMTSNPRTLAPHCSAIEALRAMRDGGFRHIPIVSEGKILGIVSRGDFTGEEMDHLESETRLWELIG
jgi:CBS domain-containing protein